MKRTASALVLLAMLGCVSSEGGHPWGSSSGGGCAGCGMAGRSGPPSVPGAQGPWGQPVPMAAPYSAAPPGGEAAARAMMARSMPMDVVQAGAAMNPGDGSGLMPAVGPRAAGKDGLPPETMISPPGVPFSPGAPGMPGAGAVMPGAQPVLPGAAPVPGVVAAVGALTGHVPSRFPTKRTEVRFAAPASMQVSWYAPSADGKPGFSGNQLEVPGRYNFVQAALYRLKLSNIPNRPGLELYPTLEVVPSNARTDPFLAHSAVPVVFTEEDFDQVVAGNFLVKVIYLPDPQYQDLATIGPDEVVSSRLEPGVDPIAEAHRRGNILLVVRMGNIDLEAPNTPAMDAPSPYMLKPAAPPGIPGNGMAPGAPGAGQVNPYAALAQRQGMPGANPYAGMPMGQPVMTPNGPMMMTPNGPVMLPPNGVPGRNANGPQLPMTLPPAEGVPAVPTSVPALPPGAGNANVPVSQLPEVPVVKTQYQSASGSSGTIQQAAPVVTGTTTTIEQPKPQRRWLFGK